MKKLFCTLAGVLLILLVGVAAAGEFTLVVSPERPHPNEEVTLKILNESGQLVGGIRGEVYGPGQEKITNILTSNSGIIKIKSKDTGRYWITIRDYKERLEFMVRKDMWWSGPTPENPRVGESIRLGVPKGVGVKILDSQGKLYLACKTKLSAIGGSHVNFTLEKAGAYQVVLGELNSEWWCKNFTLIVKEQRKLELSLDPKKVEIGKGVTFRVTFGNESVEDAKVIIKAPHGGVEEKITSSSGKIIYLPSISGEYLIQVEKANYLSCEKKFKAYNSFNLEFTPKEQGVGEEILLKVRNQEGGLVYGAKVSLPEMNLSTSVEGEVRFSLPEAKEYPIQVEKEGFWNLSYKLRVVLPLILKLNSQEVEIGKTVEIYALDQEGEELSGVNFKVTNPKGETNKIKEGNYKPLTIGKYKIYATKEGYRSQNVSFQVKSHPLEIKSQFQGNKVIVTVSSHNQPVPGIKVVVFSSGKETEKVTNEKGAIEVEVKEGEVRVKINPQGDNKDYPEKIIRGEVKKMHSFTWPFLIIVLILIVSFLVMKYRAGKVKPTEAAERREKTFIKKKGKGTSLGGA